MKNDTAFQWLKRHIGRNRVRYVLLGMLAVVSALLTGVVLTQLLRQMTQGILATDRDWTMRMAGLFLGSGLLLALVNMAKTMLQTRCSQKSECELEDTLIGIWRDAARTHNGPTGEQVHAQLRQNVSGATHGVVSYGLQVLSQTTLIVSTCLYIAFINVWILLICAVLVGFVMWLTASKTSKLGSLWQAYSRNKNTIYNKIWECVSNGEAARFLVPKRVMGAYQDAVAQHIGEFKKTKRISGLFDTIAYGSNLLAFLITAVVGSILVSAGSLTMDSLFALLIAVPTVAAALMGLPQLVSGAKQQQGILKQVSQVMEASPYQGPASQPMPDIQKMGIEDLHFSYEAHTPVVQGVSLSLQMGQLISLAGTTGCGKSTVLKLCAGLITPQGGNVRYNDIGMDEINRRALWKKIGYVSQTPQIIAGSVARNVAMNLPVEEERIWELLRAVDFDGWVKGREEGLHTHLTQGMLSSGEMQKISLARALYRRPQVLLLDEATSAMDPGSEGIVLETLCQMVRDQGLLVLAISHRQAFLQHSQKVVVMHKGQVETIDTHEQLLETCAVYRALLAQEQEGGASA